MLYGFSVIIVVVVVGLTHTPSTTILASKQATSPRICSHSQSSPTECLTYKFDEWPSVRVEGTNELTGH